MKSRSFVLALAAVVAVAGVGAAQDQSRADAAAMHKKIVAILERGDDAAPAKPAPLRTGFTDREVNAYFKVNGPEFLPEGLVNPQVTIDDGGKISAKATVDFDAALKPKQRSALDPLSWLSGKSEVTAAGIVHAANGMGTLQLESATLGGIPIPTSVLQQLVSYYTKTPDTPAGFEIDKPFPLPAKIRSVEIRRGQATVVQQ